MESEGYSDTMAYIYQTSRRCVLDVIFSPVFNLRDDVFSSLDLKLITPYCKVSSELLRMLEEAVVN
jgi:hypothetical protein